MTVRESKLILSWRTKNDMETFYSRCVRCHLVTSGFRIVGLSENMLIKTCNHSPCSFYLEYQAAG